MQDKNTLHDFIEKAFNGGPVNPHGHLIEQGNY